MSVPSYANVLGNAPDIIATIQQEIPRTSFKFLPEEPPKYSLYRRRAGYDLWKYAYMNHLLEMYRIYTEQIKKPQELDKFCRMIYENSSGEISENLQDLNDDENDLYFLDLKSRE